MNEEQQQYHYMYVLVCADETLYTGYTTDVKQRVAKHNAGKGAKYTACRGPVRLLTSARFATKHEAMSAEYQFKRLSRAEKLALIERAGEEHPFAEILAECFSLGEGQRVRHAEELEEETVATNDILIIVDVQNDFTTGALGNPDAAAKVAAIAARARGFEGTVILTQDTHEADYLETAEGRNLPVEHCVRGTEGWELSDELAELATEQGWKIYEKPTFGSVALAQDLAAENAVNPIDSIELVGFCTDICVVSNALLIKAFLPEVEVKVDADLCAGTTPAAHEAALATMRSCHIAC